MRIQRQRMVFLAQPIVALLLASVYTVHGVSSHTEPNAGGSGAGRSESKDRHVVGFLCGVLVIALIAGIFPWQFLARIMLVVLLLISVVALNVEGRDADEDSFSRSLFPYPTPQMPSFWRGMALGVVVSEGVGIFGFILFKFAAS